VLVKTITADQNEKKLVAIFEDGLTRDLTGFISNYPIDQDARQIVRHAGKVGFTLCTLDTYYVIRLLKTVSFLKPHHLPEGFERGIGDHRESDGIMKETARCNPGTGTQIVYL